MDPPAAQHQAGLDLQDRLDFERRGVPIRLSLLVAAVLVWLQAGSPALVASLLIGGCSLGSYGLIWVLLRRNPGLLLRTQLALRVLDVLLVGITLHSVHLVIPPGETFDAFYVLPVIAATATHRHVGTAVAVTASMVVMLLEHLRMAAIGMSPFNEDVLAATFIWALLFTVTGVLVSSLMRTSSDSAGRREHALNVELARQNQALQQTTNQLLASNAELESFSYSVSHDLRGPLRAVDGFSQVLVEDYSENIDEQALDYLARIRAASQRMGHLIDDLLRLSRLSRSEMHEEIVDLSAVAYSLAAELNQSDPRRNVTFDIASGLQARGDNQLLRAALENLLRNSWKFTAKHDSARIEFGSADHNGKSAYFVRDDGAGFDMAYVSKLFGPFQRLHRADEFEGTGIGLATVQRIIRRHGGEVWAEGTPEEGATFYFTLPSPA